MTIISLAGVAYFRERLSYTRERVLSEMNRRSLYLHRIALADQYRQSSAGRAWELLEACPQDLRHWEWRYLMDRVDPSLLTIHAHENGVQAVAFDSRHGRVVSAELSAVCVSDVVSGRDDPQVTAARRICSGRSH